MSEIKVSGWTVCKKVLLSWNGEPPRSFCARDATLPGQVEFALFLGKEMVGLWYVGPEVDVVDLLASSLRGIDLPTLQSWIAFAIRFQADCAQRRFEAEQLAARQRDEWHRSQLHQERMRRRHEEDVAARRHAAAESRRRAKDQARVDAKLRAQAEADARLRAQEEAKRLEAAKRADREKERERKACEDRILRQRRTRERLAEGQRRVQARRVAMEQRILRQSNHVDGWHYGRPGLSNERGDVGDGCVCRLDPQVIDALWPSLQWPDDESIARGLSELTRSLRRVKLQ